nr:TPA_asm: 22 kDa protein [Cyrtomium ophiovirus]
MYFRQLSQRNTGVIDYDKSRFYAAFVKSTTGIRHNGYTYMAHHKTDAKRNHILYVTESTDHIDQWRIIGKDLRPILIRIIADPNDLPDDYWLCHDIDHNFIYGLI